MTRALVFDSGVGGLTIADALRKAAPDWVVDYAADSGFFPYGVKTDEELRERLPRLCATLVEVAKPDVLVIACNTASTLSLDDIRARVGVPVVGTVPAIKPAAEQTKTGVIGILATPGTVRRAYLDGLERQFAAGKTVVRRGSAGAHRRELVLGRVRGFRHALAGVVQEVVNHCHESAGPLSETLDETRVPIFSPETILSILRSSAMLKT